MVLEIGGRVHRIAHEMSRHRPQLSCFLACSVLLGLAMPVMAVEPPLPGEEGAVSSGEAFSLLPGPGAIPTESVGHPTPEDEIVMPPPAAGIDQLPDVEPLGLPSDGEAMPELPNIPGLVLPGRNSVPPLPGSQPADTANPGVSPSLLPPPELQLAKKTNWYPSPIEARKASIAKGKPLLIFFAQMRPQDDGSPTARLNDDLFSIDEFNEFAAAKLILTKLQYPVGSPGKNYTEAKLAALKKFKDYFKVTGFPTVVMIDEQGRELVRLKGYRRISDPRGGPEFSTAHVHLDKLKEAVSRSEEKKRYRDQHVNDLKAQGYRLWTSCQGSSMMGKLVEAKPDRIVLKDENGRWRKVLPAQLTLFDAEWARRKAAGLLPGDAPKTTAQIPVTPVPR